MTELYLTTFVGSLLGSLHCVGMCGGLAAIASTSTSPALRSDRDRAAPALVYNAGRLIAYLALGATAGALGAALDLAGALSGLGDVAAVLAGAIVILTGMMLLMNTLPSRRSAGVRIGQPGPVERAARRLMPRLFSLTPTLRAAGLGVASGLLPCGWLYAFVVSAAGTGNPLTGVGLMGAFWLGTLPAVVSVGLGAKAFARSIGPRLTWLTPTVLVVIGVLTILHRAPLEFRRTGPAAPVMCHGHPDS